MSDKLTASFIIGTLAAVGCSSVMAATIAFDFSSTVTGSTGTLVGVTVGTEITGTVIYDSAATDTNTTNDSIGNYFMTVPPFDFSVGPPMNLTGDTSISMGVRDDFGTNEAEDIVVFNAQNPFMVATSMDWSLTFSGPTTMIGSDAIPELATIVSFPSQILRVNNRVDGSVDGSITATVTSITVVPPPTDSDGDGVLDSDDNCTLVPNGPLIPDAGGNSQLDSNGDGYGNICDADLNDDLVVNGLDVGPFGDQFGTSGPDADLNGDGVVNGLDVGPFVDMFGQAPGPSGQAP